MNPRFYCPNCGTELEIVLREFAFYSREHRIVTPLTAVYYAECPKDTTGKRFIVCFEDRKGNLTFGIRLEEVDSP